MTRQQFIAYVERHQGSFRRFLTALCVGDVSLADDIAQEAYIKAYLACDTFRDETKFKAWIYRIGYTTFLNHRRSERPAATYEEAAALSTAERADDGFRYQALYAALETLSERERTALLLHYMEDYSVKEIAGITGASPDAVKQQLSRGRRNLKEKLGKE